MSANLGIPINIKYATLLVLVESESYNKYHLIELETYNECHMGNLVELEAYN